MIAGGFVSGSPLATCHGEAVPQLALAADLTLHYEEYDYEEYHYADPWSDHGTFVLLHGFAESAAVWFAWTPQLARHHRVLAIDLRGFGRSSVPADALGYPWSTAGFSLDIVGLLDALGAGPAHVVGARMGAAVGMQIAVDRPDLLASLSWVSGLARREDVRGLATGDEVVSIDVFAQRIHSQGLAAWCARTGRTPLGTAAPEPQPAFWSELMAESDEEVFIAMMRAARRLDLFDALGRIRVPALSSPARTAPCRQSPPRVNGNV